MAQPISSASLMDERRAVAWVGKSVIFKGTLVSSEDMMIDGQIEGTVELQGRSLTVGPNADVHAEIVAGDVTIHGTVVGTIRASGKVDISATGHIEGDVVASRIAIADGAAVCGRVDTLAEQAAAGEPPVQLAIV